MTTHLPEYWYWAPYSDDEDAQLIWEPYFDDEEAQLIVGKHLLVGVTHRNDPDGSTSVEQFHGTIIRASRIEGIIVRVSGSAEERWVPPDLSRLEPAAPGEYRLKGTDEVVVDPDFLSTWAVYPEGN